MNAESGIRTATVRERLFRDATVRERARCEATTRQRDTRMGRSSTPSTSSESESRRTLGKQYRDREGAAKHPAQILYRLPAANQGVERARPRFAQGPDKVFDLGQARCDHCRYALLGLATAVYGKYRSRMRPRRTGEACRLQASSKNHSRNARRSTHPA